MPGHAKYGGWRKKLADTAQIYRNEVEAGVAIRESGLARNDIFVTTKWSGMDGLDIATSIQNSLKNVRVASIYIGLIIDSRPLS